MNQKVVSSVHSLRLIDIRRLSICTFIESRAIVSFLPGERDFITVPGSVTVLSTADGATYEKEIRCLSACVGYQLADRLAEYSRSNIIAIYTDERGMERVCGSPEYPLRLRYNISEGVASVILKGKTDRDDAFLMVS